MRIPVPPLFEKAVVRDRRGERRRRNPGFDGEATERTFREGNSS